MQKTAQLPFLEQKFNPNNAAHLSLIAQQLVNFKAAHQRLKTFDFFGLEVPAGVSLALWATSCCNFIGVAALCSVLYYGNAHVRSSNYLKEPYQKCLSNLVSCYKWYKKEWVPSKQNETLLELEKTIELYVDKAYLFSEASAKKSRFSFLKKPTAATPARVEEKKESASLGKIGAQVSEAIRLYRYGYEPRSEPVKPIENPIPVVGSLLLKLR